MKPIAQTVCLTLFLLVSTFSVASGAPAHYAGAPIVAQYSGSYGGNYGSSNNYRSSPRVSYRSYRGLFKLGALVIILIVSAIGFLIRKMSGD